MSEHVTRYFGQDSLFYDIRQSLSVRVVQLLMTVSMTKGLQCREPWKLLKVPSTILRYTLNQTHNVVFFVIAE